MKKMKLLTIAMMAAMMTSAAVPAFASEKVSEVRISLVPDEDTTLSPGKIAEVEPLTDDSGYYIDEYNTSGSSLKPRKSYTYTMDILPEDGYTFSSDVTVHVYGAVDVDIKSKSSGKIEVKAKTYPFYVLEEPTNIKIDEETKKATWDEVEYAKKYSVVVAYTNKDGEEKKTKKSTTKNSIDLNGYIGKYDDVDISVRALAGTTEGDKFISDSDYMWTSGEVNDDLSDDEYKFSIQTTGSDGSKSSSTEGKNNSNSDTSNSGGPGMSGISTSSPNGWNGSSDSWCYVNNGKKIVGWLHLNNEWFLFDSKGTMKYGWQYVDGHWYYLNPVHDGSFGKMLVGWNLVNGKWYYMNMSHDGTYGAMLANTRTPDGYYVNADGAWVQ